MHSDSVLYTAFTTPSGHLEFLRMPFGLCGASFTFQRALNSILHNEDRKICLIYLDDIIVFGKTKLEHDNNLIQVLTKLENAGVLLSKDKGMFSKISVNFLGHIISERGIETDPRKTRKIKDLPKPSNVKELSSILAFANYYRQFVKSFSDIAAPLLAVSNNEM